MPEMAFVRMDRDYPKTNSIGFTFLLLIVKRSTKPHFIIKTPPKTEGALLKTRLFSSFTSESVYGQPAPYADKNADTSKKLNSPIGNAKSAAGS